MKMTDPNYDPNDRDSDETNCGYGCDNATSDEIGNMDPQSDNAPNVSGLETSSSRWSKETFSVCFFLK